MKLKLHETITDCVPSDSQRDPVHCQDCDKLAYQTVVVSLAGISQRVPLCGVHFIYAWADYPELRRLDASTRLSQNAA